MATVRTERGCIVQLAEFLGASAQEACGRGWILLNRRSFQTFKRDQIIWQDRSIRFEQVCRGEHRMQPDDIELALEVMTLAEMCKVFGEAHESILRAIYMVPS